MALLYPAGTTRAYRRTRSALASSPFREHNPDKPGKRRDIVSTYRPRDPRGKLREVTTNWTLSMRVAGRAPNCGVVFDEDASAHAGPQARGWLIGDRRPETRGDRYLILDDGDVWRARAAEAPEGSTPTWMQEPDDDLVTLLARSLGDARLGGAGWLELVGRAERVEDRRREWRATAGPERRRF
jgi:hypothetical protein